MIPDVSLLIGRHFVSKSDNVCKFKLARDTAGDAVLELEWENEMTKMDIEDAEAFVLGVTGVAMKWRNS